MKYQLSYRVEFYITLSDLEFKKLDLAMKNSEYKIETMVGGFWYGRSNARNWNKKKKERENYFMCFTFRELDKVLKAISLQCRNEFFGDLYNKIYNILKAGNEIAGGLNTHSAEMLVK